MSLKTGFGRPSGRRVAHCRRLGRASWLAAVLVASPAMADPEADGVFRTDLLGVFLPAGFAAAANDDELRDAQGRGAGQQALRRGEDVAVILWDEPGTGGSTGFPKHDGNSLVTIRYGGHAK